MALASNRGPYGTELTGLIASVDALLEKLEASLESEIERSLGYSIQSLAGQVPLLGKLLNDEGRR